MTTTAGRTASTCCGWPVDGVVDALAHAWAKGPTQPALEGERLSAHTGQVLARLAQRRQRSPTLPTLCGVPRLWDLAAWACLLHDVGKLALGFQAMLRGGPRFPHRHEVLSLVAVGWLELGEHERALVAAGVATHHKDLREIFELYPFEGSARTDLLAELPVDAQRRLRDWLMGAGVPSVARLDLAPLPALNNVTPPEALGRAMTALQGLRDALEARAATAPLCVAARFMRGLVILADHAGSAHAHLRHGPGFGHPGPVAERVLARVRQVRPAGMLWPHQQTCAETVGDAILRAPTGSGKTEAALLWAARQRAHGPGAAPLFYVLPYRASLDAMRARLPDLAGLHDGEVVLQHASSLTSLYTHLLGTKGYTSTAAVRAAHAERDLARLMTAPVRLLTPYQLLRAFFGLRGHDAVLTDASAGLFVWDELHAYDIPRLALMLAATRHLSRELGGRSLAMSATFPSVLRAAWCEALGREPVDIVADPETQGAFRRHRLGLLHDDLLGNEAAGALAGRVDAGESALVVTTTVARAQRLFDQLRARFGDQRVSLLHGRFTAADRARKERALAQRMGTRARARGAPACILVATQVVEVSLDLDFDVLFSDPAPIEALLQRFGRVNRSLAADCRDVIIATAIPAEGRHVYEQADLLRTLNVLRPAVGAVIEERDLQGWVDAVYAPVAEAWRARVARAVRSATEDVVATNRPLDEHPELAEAFERLFDGAEVVPASLQAEYERLLRDEPLRAPSLCVPVSTRQLALWQRAGRLTRLTAAGARHWVARLPYDGERGLELRA